MISRNFNPFPVLITKRLVLRQLSIEDDKEIFALRSNSNVNKYLDRQTAKTIKDARNFINKINNGIKNNGSIYWAITLTGEGNSMVGAICLFEFSDENSKCEIGFELLPGFQKQGIMQEAILKIIEFSKQITGLEIIEAYTHKNNLKASNLLQKFNFKRLALPDKINPDYFIYTYSIK